jgi:putative transposase
MRSPPYPSDLTDDQWSLLEPLVPRAAKDCRPRKTDMREVVNAIFYLNRAGCPWRMLPRDFPPWQTVYHYFEGWRVNGTWARIVKTLRKRVRIAAGRKPPIQGDCAISGNLR